MVLDCGAMGIVAPMVMDAAEAEAIVAATKYPPRGNRSVGGGMHALNFGTTAEEYYQKADDEILVIIQTEHIEAVEIADEIYAVPGLDAVFVGPNDLSFSMRAADGTPPSKEVFEATLTRIREAAQRQKLPCGLHVFSAADAVRRAREGWQFIAVVSELKMMLDGAAEIVRQVDPRTRVEQPGQVLKEKLISACMPRMKQRKAWLRSSSATTPAGMPSHPSTSARIRSSPRVTTSSGSCSHNWRLNSSSESGPR